MKPAHLSWVGTPDTFICTATDTQVTQTYLTFDEEHFFSFD